MPRLRLPILRRAVLTGAALAAFLALAGCSTYVDRNARLRDDLAAARFDDALTGIEKAEKGKDRLLNLLERALVLHYADRWDESNVVFEEAEQLAADLYTKSVSEGAFSLLTNDNAIAYRATPYEMALIPYFRALNYVYLDERDEAVVEARKAGLLLRDFREDLDEDADAADLLDDNAFLSFFSGLVFEWGGEVNDAFIAYRTAARAYATATAELHVATPPGLADDLVRTAGRLGFKDELAALRDELPGLFADADPPAPGSVEPTRGEVVLLLELGFVPHKISQRIDVPIFKDDGKNFSDRDAWAVALRGRYVNGWSSGAKIDYWLTVALPGLIDEPPAVAGARVSAGVAGAHAAAVPVEDLGGRTRLAFDRGLGGVLVKTLLRGLAKYAFKEKADEEGAVAGFLANLLGSATEQADTRSWLTLPYSVAVARLSLPPGVHDLEVELIDAAGLPLRRETLPGVAVRAGDRVFVSRRVF